jgi:hypothetical protein
MRKDNVPGNLYWGSAAENQEDCYKHGTLPQSERHYKAALTEEDVQFIRAQYVPYSKEFGCQALAGVYGVSKSAINNVVKGRNYRRPLIVASSQTT